jgi:hypothetical protein
VLDLLGDAELVVLLMSEPEPSDDLGEDVHDQFPIPQLLEDGDLVVPETQKKPSRSD